MRRWMLRRKRRKRRRNRRKRRKRMMRMMRMMMMMTMTMTMMMTMTMTMTMMMMMMMMMVMMMMRGIWMSLYQNRYRPNAVCCRCGIFFARKRRDGCGEFDIRGIYPALYCVSRIKGLSEIYLRSQHLWRCQPTCFLFLWVCPEIASSEMG